MSNELEAEVNQMCEEAKNAGLNGVPTAIIDGKWLINGGQSSEVFVRVSRVRPFSTDSALTHLADL